MGFTDSAWYKSIRTMVKVFAASVLGQLITFGDGIFDLTALQWKNVAAAAIAAVILYAYNFLNPKYTDYGVGKDANVLS